MPSKFSLITFFALITACSPMQTGSNRTPTNGIVNGEEVTEQTPLSSRIVYVYGQEGTDIFGCTGSLLPGNIVLTAAHCLADGKQEMRIEFGRKVGSITDPDAKIIRKVIARRHNILHDKKDRFTQLENDIALLKFEGEVPTGYETFAAPTSSEFTTPLVPNDRLYMIGYGITDVDRNDDGTLRETSVSQSVIGGIDKQKNKALIVLDQQKTGICEGDSGGPLSIFKNAKPVVLGIASVFVPLAGDQDPKAHKCKGISLYTRTSNQMKWLTSKYVELLKPGASEI